MNILKTLARKILKKEIQEKQKEFDKFRSDYFTMLNEKVEEERTHAKTRESMTKENSKLQSEVDNLKKQVEIMSKYYGLDKEPTTEEKIQIRIDLKIHELEMQILKERRDRFEVCANLLPVPSPYLYDWRTRWGMV